MHVLTSFTGSKGRRFPSSEEWQRLSSSAFYTISHNGQCTPGNNPPNLSYFVRRQQCSSPASLHRCSTRDVFFWASRFPASVSTAPGDSPTQTSIALPGTTNLSHLPFPKRELSSPTPGSSQFISVCDKHKPYPAPERPHCLPLGDLCHPKCICSHKLLSQV